MNRASRQLFVFTAILSGCSRPDPFEGAMQGIVEREERVLAFEVPGRIVEMAVRRGDRVSPGGLVARLDNDLARLGAEGRSEETQAARARARLLRAGSRPEEIHAAEAELRSAQSAEALAVRQLERERLLVRGGARPPVVLDELETQMQRAHEARIAVEQRLRALRVGPRPLELENANAQADAIASAAALEASRVSKYELRALSEGTVTELHAAKDEVVSAGTPIATVCCEGAPYAEVYVNSDRVGKIGLGQKGWLTADGYDKPFAVVVEQIANRTEFTPRFLFSPRERATLVVRIRVRIEDPGQQLRAGVPAAVRLQS